MTLTAAPIATAARTHGCSKTVANTVAEEEGGCGDMACGPRLRHVFATSSQH